MPTQSRRRTAALVALTTLALTGTPLAATAAPLRDAGPTWSTGTAISVSSTPPGGLGYWCSTGLPARKGGQTYLLTAQHCVTGLDQPIYTRWNNGKRARLGTVAGISDRLDVAAIRTTGTVSPRYRGAPVRVASLRVGSKACQHGVRSGTKCGLIVTRIHKDARGQVRVIARATAGAAALPGDSGGPVVDTQGRIVGLVSATSKDRRWLAYTPAKAALDAWGMRPIR